MRWLDGIINSMDMGLGGLKGVKPPEEFGERSRDWSLGHAGDEGPPLSMTGESRGCSRAAAPVCCFPYYPGLGHMPPP